MTVATANMGSANAAMMQAAAYIFPTLPASVGFILPSTFVLAVELRLALGRGALNFGGFGIASVPELKCQNSRVTTILDVIKKPRRW